MNLICLASPTDKQEQQNQQSSSPTVQVRAPGGCLTFQQHANTRMKMWAVVFICLLMSLQETASSVSVSAPSVVYSVLDFPKRASALSDITPHDTEYANISYVEKM